MRSASRVRGVQRGGGAKASKGGSTELVLYPEPKPQSRKPQDHRRRAMSWKTEESLKGPGSGQARPPSGESLERWILELSVLTSSGPGQRLRGLGVKA